jgi:hypothetical protein
MSDTAPKALFEIMEHNPSRYCYALVEHYGIEGFDTYWGAFQPKAMLLWQPLKLSSIAQVPGIAPLLLRVEGGNACETLLLWLAKTVGWSSCTLVFTSDLDWDAMQVFWQARSEAIYPNGQSSLLRSYCAPLLGQLWPLLSLMQQDAFLAELSGLYLPVDDERWMLLGGSPKKSVPYSPLNLDDEQYELLSRDARRLQHSLEIYLRLRSYRSQVLCPQHIQALFFEGIALAERYFPKEDARTCEIIAAHRFILGSEFFMHPEFVALVKRRGAYKATRQFVQTQQFDAELQRDYHREEWLIAENQ